MKYSRQRKVILDIVQSTTQHPTAEWVFEQARKEIPSIGIATVYRNLNALVDMREIQRISTGDKLDRFDGYMEEHFHIRCNRCGCLVDLKVKNPDALHLMQESIRDAFSIDDANVHINETLLVGICSECRKKEN